MDTTEVDGSKIGEYIGAGLQHRVFAYGENQVIKKPRFWMRLSATSDLKEERLKLMQERIGNYLLETSVMPYKNSYCYIQKRVFNPRMFKLSDADDYRKELAGLRKLDQGIREDRGLSLDFLGSETYRQLLFRIISRREIKTGNIVIDEDAPHGIYILDADFFRTRPWNIRHPREIVFACVSFAGYLLNELVMKILKI